MTERLKKIDRAILELISGILIFTIFCQLAGLLLPVDRVKFAFGLWSGAMMACILAIHMWKALNKAMLCDEKTAVKIMSGGYLIRYFFTAAYLVFLFYTGVGYALVGFLGVMGLKAGAYLQPMIHKFYNRLFHETDPVPQPLEEESEVLESEK